VIAMTPQQCKAALLGNLDESMSHALALKEILDAERHALEHNDTMSLSDAAVRKRHCIGRLEELDAGRADISSACGFQPLPNAVNELAAWCEDHDVIAASWGAFLDVVRQCSDLNSGNGAIIRLRQSQVRDMLSLLRAGTAADRTYGPTGENEGDLGTRSLAEA
jgi:flagellar biosynthesis/type III secretory pathway chaperone